MKTTRVRILEYINKKGLSSTIELSRALKTSPANMRHHLSILVEEGAVEIVAQRPATGRGRPAHLYSLTSQSQSHNLDRLASVLLDELAAEEHLPSINAARLEKIALRLAGRLPAGERSLTQRLYLAVQRLNQLQYQARWEARSEAPRIIFNHCPYAAILSEHPELCSLDAVLMTKLLSTPVHQTHRLAFDSSGARHCIFALRLP